MNSMDIVDKMLPEDLFLETHTQNLSIPAHLYYINKVQRCKYAQKVGVYCDGIFSRQFENLLPV